MVYYVLGKDILLKYPKLLAGEQKLMDEFSPSLRGQHIVVPMAVLQWIVEPGKCSSEIEGALKEAANKVRAKMEEGGEARDCRYVLDNPVQLEWADINLHVMLLSDHAMIGRPDYKRSNVDEQTIETALWVEGQAGGTHKAILLTNNAILAIQANRCGMMTKSFEKKV